MMKAVSTVDRFFTNRELPYDGHAQRGDTVRVLPDTFVAVGPGDDIFEITALGVTPVYVTLTEVCPVNGVFPSDAFWMRLPDGTVIYSTKWVSGYTRHAV
jgi:hypothetical protein